MHTHPCHQGGCEAHGHLDRGDTALLWGRGTGWRIDRRGELITVTLSTRPGLGCTARLLATFPGPSSRSMRRDALTHRNPCLDSPPVLNKRHTLRFRKCTLFKILEFFRCSLVQQESLTNAHICLFLFLFVFFLSKIPLQHC